jgi:uncharacterized protein
MEPSPLPDPDRLPPPASLSPEHRDVLLRTAADSIDYGVERGEAFPVVADRFDPPLQARRASFVTLFSHGKLRGCIGATEARMPLIRDVSEHAFAAAFRDPRFPPVRIAELPDLEIHISILSRPEPMIVDGLEDLAAQLRPGVDGLILEDGHRGATFLPAVWDSLPEPAAFVRALLQKAGLPNRGWSPTLQAYRYTADAIP